MKDARESVCAEPRVMLTFWRVLMPSAPRILKFMTNSKAIAEVGMLILLRMVLRKKSEIWVQNGQNCVHWSVTSRMKEEEST